MTQVRRSGRDWAADLALFGAAVGYAAWFYLLALADPGKKAGPLTIGVGVAIVASVLAVAFRRRWPVAVAVAMIPVSTVVDLSAGAQLVALLTVAIHRPVKTTAVVCALRVLAVSVYVPVRASSVLPADVVAWVVAFAVATSVGVVGWGLFVRHRRQLIMSLRDRAERAEAEAKLRTEQAQHLVREEIAREMHDLLGHRLSLLSVHAGALEFHPDAPPEQVARAAAVIRESTHQAMQDLREVIGVLRAPTSELPQPTYADLPALIAESARGGMRVELVERGEGEVPERAGRTAYRIVREALTNARQHAPGAEVTVTVERTPGDGLSVEVRNGAADRTTGRPGSGHGLAGLAERVALAGGRLEHDRTPDGGFRLAGWLPWPS
ncbi:sensor histidine kinase [Fodinicola acaciae]|uniref:sensor histidine kinase n=1 Tax=Fodinicola acaciae TaxID=2681555 RepID=UPI0013D611BF|nr:histidine kinase [Fodinicola acaciae]